MMEMLAVLAIAGMLMLMSGAGLHHALQRQQARVVASESVRLVQLARMRALKEKVRHRIVFHDENADAPNRCELQRMQSGSFQTLPGEIYDAPVGVAILGGGLTNSMDNLTVSRRGTQHKLLRVLFTSGHNPIDIGLCVMLWHVSERSQHRCSQPLT